MATTVVHLSQPHDVYVGRGNGSPYGNPYKIGVHGTRGDVIDLFRSYLRSNPALVERIRRELKGKRLGCFCKPLPCHGDVLAAVADGAEP